MEEAEEIPEEYDITGEDDEEVIQNRKVQKCTLQILQLPVIRKKVKKMLLPLRFLENTQQSLRILRALGSLVTSDDLDQYAQKIDELNDNILILNQNVVISSQNEAAILKFQLGFIVAIFGALIIYFLFSKLH